MTDDQARLNELLDTALDLPADERQRWFEALPDDNPALKQRLKALLERAARVETSDFLQTLPKIGDAESAAGDQIGPYRLIREIGSGGMGSVWLAERHDGALNRAVALKFLRAAGPNDTLADRLQRERDILAALVHPGIARLYDAGIARDGLPYIALEYIEGEHIDQFCRARNLDVRARVELVRQVAQAVAYAHGELVVHRDLKPTNVLVSADGRTHLLDFGIAKLLEDGRAVETRLTQLGGKALTPEYASPEQILGQPITTASDVYSLGVILYELLTATRPYTLKRDSRGALEDAIVDEEPQRPSVRVGRSPRARALRGDLDAIVLKALKKAPGERYRTMDAFAEDLSRYLDGRPVLARPDSTWYRVRKFALRNRLAVVAATAVLLAVLVGAGISIWQARIAIAERSRAEEANRLMASIFTDADPYGEAGKTLTAVELLDQAHRRIAASKVAGPEQRLELLTLLALTLNNFQEVERAEAIIGAAIASAGQELPPHHPRMLHARVVHALTLRYVEPSRLAAELDTLLPMLRQSTDADPGDLPGALESALVLALGEGRNEDAERFAREGIEVASRRFSGDDHAVLAMKWGLVRSLLPQRKLDEALALAAEVMPKTLALYEGNIRNPHVIEARELYGRVLAQSGRVAEGIDVLADAVQGARELFGPTSVAVCYFASNLAGQRLHMRQLQAAQENVAESLRACSVAPGHDSMPYTITQQLEATIVLAARKPQAALERLAAVREVYAKAGKGMQKRLLDAQADSALAMAMTGDLAGARKAIEEVIATHSAGGKPKPEYTHIRGTIEHLAGRYQEAIALQQQALQQIEDGPMADFTRTRVLVQLGLSQIEAGDSAANATLEQALQLATKLGLHPDPMQADARLALGRLHLQRSQPAAALPLLQAADEFWRSFAPENRAASEAARWLAQGYRALGREADANEALARAKRVAST